MCHLKQFDGRPFKNVWKRQLFEPFTFFFNSKEFITLDVDGKFKCFCKTEMDIDQTKVTLSYYVRRSYF
jgi:hypothetical protein